MMELGTMNETIECHLASGKIRTARKSHSCRACDKTIVKGEKYLSVTLPKLSGRFLESDKFCCKNCARKFAQNLSDQLKEEEEYSPVGQSPLPEEGLFEAVRKHDENRDADFNPWGFER